MAVKTWLAAVCWTLVSRRLSCCAALPTTPLSDSSGRIGRVGRYVARKPPGSLPVR